MLTIHKSHAALLLALAVAGCTTTTITNLTPTQQPRNSTGQYLIEYQWDSNQQSIRPATITPFVVVGFDTYKMQLVPKLTNRWQAYVPVTEDQTALRYHFKVDYEYNRIGKPGLDSKLSPEYRMEIR